jgi:long-chain acyl-CoA synthetase
MNTLDAFLQRQAETHGERLAVQSRPRYRTLRLSYAELKRRVDGLAAALAESGVEPGDRVLLHAYNSPDWVAAFFAILARRAVAVPLNPRSAPEQLGRIVASAEPRLALASAHAPWTAAPLPALTIESIPGAGPGPAVQEVQEAEDPDALAELIYTSGTTGDPKGVMLTHRNLLSNLEAVSEGVPLTPDDHILTLVPLFHVYGQITSLLVPLHAGCAATYLPAPSSRTILDALAHTPATHFVAVPAVLKTMMDRLESRLGRIPGLVRRALRARIRARISKSLRVIVSGGAPLDPVVEEKWLALGFEVLQGYGLTETSPVVAANTPAAHRTGSVGKPVSGVEVKISPEGEILVRGPNVMAGYWRDPERTAAAFADGWLKTDDGGHFDEDGFLYVHGRRKYMILGPGGENVFPEDLEAELNRVPGVTDSAVIGLTREGRTVIHAVLLCDPAQAETIVAQANRKLASHQQILSWSVWPEADFPRSVTRKVKKEEVIRALEGKAAAPAAAMAKLTPLKRILAEVTRADPGAIADASRLGADLGIDSLLRIELVSRIEEQLNVMVEEAQITLETTVADLEALVEKQKGVAPRLGQYPRWSLGPGARCLRPLAQAVFLKSWLSPFYRLRVEGLENLEHLQGPIILMANHRSFLDSAVATFAIPKPVRSRLAIAASTEVLYAHYRWAVPIGELTLNAFPFPTGLHENIRLGLDYVGRLLDDGWNVLVFPEGRMRLAGEVLLSLKGGAGVIAVEMGAPIVPMAIIGTDRIMPPKKIMPRRRGVVTVRFGQPLPIRADESYEAATARIEAALRGLLEAETGC